MDRRNFLKTAATIGAATLPIKKLKAEKTGEKKEFLSPFTRGTRSG